jgi:hypothetical protein
MTKLPPLPPLPAKHDRKPKPPKPTRYRVCEVCSQTYDIKNLDEVFHHGPEPHDPRPNPGDVG